MGLFDLFKKKSDDQQPQQQQSQQQTQQQPQQQSAKVSLEKKTQERISLVKVTLKKKKVPNLKARVAVVMDASASMEWNAGIKGVQSIIERTIPIAMQMDDDQEMQVFKFNGSTTELPNVNMNNLYNYVDSYYTMCGGTNYAVAIRAVVDKFGIKEPSSIPTYVMFFTDGDSPKEAAQAALIKASKYNIFFQFIGLGEDDMSTLESLDDMNVDQTGVDGRYVDNADFFRVGSTNKYSDEEIYDMLLNEFPAWIKAFENNPNVIHPTGNVERF